MKKRIPNLWLALIRPIYFAVTSYLYGAGRKPTMIIGLGSGRCGTQSLAEFLNDQRRSLVSHESGFLGDAQLAWVLKSSEDEKKTRRYFDEIVLPCFQNKYLFAGDVALYFLNYVDLIYEMYQQTYDLRFICMKRDRSQTVKSFVEYTNLTNTNRWIEHDGSRWTVDREWDGCFPKFEAITKEEAVEKYWDWYYAKVEAYQTKYKNIFMTVDLDDFNTRQKQKEILDFLGYPSLFRKYASHPVYNTLKEYRNWFKKKPSGCNPDLTHF